MERERSVQRSVCQMACLIVAQFVFLMSGAAVFMWLERDTAQKGYRETLETLTEVRKTLKLTPHEEEVLQEAFGKGFSFSDEKLPPTAEHAWDFISTLYFSITSTTTIGYGHSSPETTSGQVFCILFSLMGIPLHMVTLGSIGKHLSSLVSRFLDWSAERYIVKGQGRKDIGTFLVTSSLLILFVIFSAGSVRLVMGDVSYVEAIYFIYVTISTIGFGDFVIRFEQHKDYDRVMILIMWAVSLYVGMSLLSATIMSISTRAKHSYRTVFDYWDMCVLRKAYKDAHRPTTEKEERAEEFILVDKKFLIAQLDLQTDPNKRAEIKKWLDAYELGSESEDTSDWTSNPSESDTNAE